MQTLDTRDAVAGLEDTAHFLARRGRRVGRDVSLDRFADLLRSDRKLRHSCSLMSIRALYV